MVFPSERTEMVVNEEPMTLVDGEANAKVVNIVVGGWEKKIGSYSVTKLDGMCTSTRMTTDPYI
jgi:hypothetical protein